MHFKPFVMALALGFCLARVGVAFDVTRPAVVRFAVVDAEGKPIPDVAVRLEGRNDLKGVTDTVGRATLAVPPPGKITWQENVILEKAGLAPQTIPFTLFAGAQFDQAATMEGVHRTRIHVTTLEGKAVPFAQLMIIYALQGVPHVIPTNNLLAPPTLRVDEQGNYLWDHGTVLEGFALASNGHMEWFQDAPDITLKLPEEEVRRSIPHALAGRLLLADSTPAAGWYVSEGGGYGFSTSMGGFLFLTSNAQRLRPVGADGTFEIKEATTSLFAVSPQGVPVTFTLSPTSWEPGAHHVTFTLPKFSGSKTGRVLDDAGRPIAGLGIFPKAFSLGAASWELSIGGAPRGEMRINDQGDILKTLTDADGRFSIPVPYGAWFSVEADRRGWSLVAPPFKASAETPGDSEYRLKRETLPGPSGGRDQRYKDITIQLVDSAGKAVQLDSSLDLEAFVGNRAAIWGKLDEFGILRDSRGLHFLVEPDADKINITWKEDRGEWKYFNRTVLLSGKEDQVQTITLGAELHNSPLEGVVLDAGGKPVGNISIALHMQDSGKHWGGNYGTTVTDAQGHFRIAGTPGGVGLRIPAFSFYNHQPNPAGWAFQEARGQTNLEVHLKLYSAVRIVLPAGWTRPLYDVELVNDPAGASNSAMLHYDAATHSLESRYAFPGTYHLYGGQFPELADIESQQIAIKEGQENVIDLSTRAFIPQKPERWAMVKVLDSAGKVQSGVQVTVVSDEMLPKEGQTGVDLMTSEYLINAATDVSDDRGLVRLRVTPGRTYVAVAHFPGVSAGWQVFTPDAAVPVGEGVDATVDLRAVRSIELPRISDNMYQIKVTFVSPRGIEGRALNQLGSLNGLPYQGGLAMQPLEKLSLLDLPIGTEIEMDRILGGDFAKRRVEVVAGEGVLPVGGK